MTFTTLNTIIEDILKIASGSIVSASNPFSRRQIEDWVHQYRAILLARELDRDNYVNPDYIQEIPGLKLEQVDLKGNVIIVQGFPYEFDLTLQDESGRFLGDNYMLRTNLQVPKTIDLNHKSGITFIGDADGNEIQLVHKFRNSWQKHKRYAKNELLAMLYNNKILFTNNVSLDNITVRGVFENPMEVGRFINPNTNLPVMTYDSPYPIPNNLLPILKEMVLSKEMKIIVQSPSDVKNDSDYGVAPKVENKFNS